MSNRTHHFEVPPDPSLMEDIGATSFTVAEAIVELVANSLDARPEDGRTLAVMVDIAPDRINVVDDASGMDLETLAEAVRLGVKMDVVSKTRKQRKGMFGLGMKTAAASLGRKWSIVTRPLEGDTDFRVTFDLGAYSARRGESRFDWSVDIEEWPTDAGGVLGDRRSGTAIVIEELRERDPMRGRVLELLGSAYRPHIDRGDRFFVNGQEALPPVYEFVDDSRQDIDLALGSEAQYHIIGWVALDRQTHNSGDYGFNLYRKDQLIEAWNKDWFPPHLMTSRIIGEVHLDFVQPNFHKQGFETQDVNWKLASATMREFLKPVVRASREMSRGKNAAKYAKAVDGLNQAMGKASAVGVLSRDADDAITDSTPERQGGESSIDVGPNTLLLRGESIALSYVVEDFSSDQTPWDFIYDGETRELQAVLNASSRLFDQMRDQKFLGMLAIADCVTRYLVEERDFEASRAREIRDRWLYLALGNSS